MENNETHTLTLSHLDMCYIRLALLDAISNYRKQGYEATAYFVTEAYKRVSQDLDTKATV